MHGHLSDGRLAEKSQGIAIRLAKSGYAVLFVDAFGSGERAAVHGEFEYHGGMVGGNLLNIGEPLLGIQVIDNMRAVDLLCSLPFVDGERIGATGVPAVATRPCIWRRSMNGSRRRFPW